MQKLPIPDDWQEEDGYILVLACVPDSLLWRSIVRGQIHNLTRGRSWDESTGIIKDAQAIGWEIYDSLMTCKLDDLVTSLENINVTIQTQQETMDKLLIAIAQIRTAMVGGYLQSDLDNVRETLEAIDTILAEQEQANP